MSRNALSRLEFGDKTRKRALWEAFEYSVPAAGVVVVRNESYAEPDEHTHSVNVEAGVPVGCSCNADEYQPGACKHRVAVAITAPVLEAASASSSESGADGDGKRAMADGGQVLEAKPQGSSEETTHAPGCDNPECEGYDADGRPLLSWECWEVWA